MLADSSSAIADVAQPADWVQVDGEAVPRAPSNAQEAGVEAHVLLALILRAASTVAQFSTQWIARTTHLAWPFVRDLLEQLRDELLLETLGESGPLGYRYTLSQRGRERADQLMRISRYVGPAPVPLDAYAESRCWQVSRLPGVSPGRVASAISGLVLPAQAGLVAGLAASSGRSLLVYGPPGNGKSTLGRLLHEALEGDLWIPHCLAAEDGVIRLFDPRCHTPVSSPADTSPQVDRRWVRIRRPLIVAGGELTLDALDLTFSEASRAYEAPLHVKANGGTLLIDDFGRQRISPEQLLNRWIIPLEHRVDFLTLQTGQKLEVPLRQGLVIATNLDLAEVGDQAFLRRMGYRLYLGAPSAEAYVRIFERCAADHGLTVPPGLVDRLLDRYRAEGVELRCCEARDLIERALDVCRFEGRPLVLDDEVMDLAWGGYFGQRLRMAEAPSGA